MMPETSQFIGRWRASAVLASFAMLTLPLMPVQAIFLKTSTRAARRFPHWYHRQVCKLLGIRLHIDGAVAPDRPVLLVANHTSWLDIPVLSAVAPVSFIAKQEVGGWPFVSQLARLQRSVFVDRTRRTAVGETTSEMVTRLVAGDTLVLFAEGTSTDGNRVLPLRTALFGAALPGGLGERPPSQTVVQTCAIVYDRLHGIPIARAERPLVGWYGDMELGSHAWELLGSGPLDVKISIGAPVAIASFAGRKALAGHAESELRKSVVRLLRHRRMDDPVNLVVQSVNRPVQTGIRASAKWS